MRKKRQYERFIKQAETDRELTRLAGQITNLRKGNIEQAELISGEDLLPPVDPIEVERERRAREVKNQPISRAIEEVRNEVVGLRPAIENAKPDLAAIEAPPVKVVRNIPFSYPWLTEENKAKLINRGFNPDMLYIQHIYNEDFQEERAKTVNVNREIGRKWRNEGLTINEKDEIQNLIRKYRQALDGRGIFMMGSGLAGAKAAKPRMRKTKATVECPILDQITTRAKVLIGEISAGNTSQDLRNELSRILLTLYKNKRISKAEYRRFAKL